MISMENNFGGRENPGFAEYRPIFQAYKKAVDGYRFMAVNLCHAIANLESGKTHLDTVSGSNIPLAKEGLRRIEEAAEPYVECLGPLVDVARQDYEGELAKINRMIEELEGER